MDLPAHPESKVCGFTQSLKLRIGRKPNAQRAMRSSSAGFTLIETLVAITILTIAVAAPLTLAAQSLLAAFNARDQVTAFHLAQEAIETVRAQRDHNLLEIVKAGADMDWLGGLYVETLNLNGDVDTKKPFKVDAVATNTGNNFIICNGEEGTSCDYLRFNKTVGLYGHETGDASRFRRFVRITEVADTNKEEVTVRAEVQWRTGRLGGTRKVVVEENLYKWVAGVTN